MNGSGSDGRVGGNLFNRGLDSSRSFPLISSNYFDSGTGEASLSNEAPSEYDPNRRSSLGAESLLEHDMNEEAAGNLDSEVNDIILLDAHLGLEYADDIFMLNRYKEQQIHPRNFIDDQPQVTQYMRCTLINWLIKVNNELRFGPETIFIGVSLTDRFLGSTPIAQDCLQLLAVCSLFVAAKLEESLVPRISALVSLCGSTYKHHHFRRMESLLLSTLRFELHSPTSWFFVTYITLKSCQQFPLDKRALNLGRYVIETCLGSYQICQFFPSEQGASAMVFAYLVLYLPNSIYNETNIDTKPEAFGKERSQGTEDIFEKVSSLNGAASSLMWTLKEIFSITELQRIGECLFAIKDYMQPFLQSSFLGLESSCVSNHALSKAEVLQPQSSCKDSLCCCTETRSVYNEDRERIERINVAETFDSSSQCDGRNFCKVNRNKCSHFAFGFSKESAVMTRIKNINAFSSSSNQEQAMDEEPVPSKQKSTIRSTANKIILSELDVT